MIPARESYVYGKAAELARRMRIEQDKKQAAHLICQRLITLLKLGHGARHAG